MSQRAYRLLRLAYVAGAILALPINAGWTFAYFTTRFPGHERETLGNAVAMAILPSLTWPIGVPLIYCLSGFAEHGWRLTFTSKERP